MVSERADKPRGTFVVLGWSVIVLSVTVLLVFGALRLVSMAQRPPPSATFDVRYVQHPWVALLHIVPGLLFLTLAPLQFVPRIRQRHIGFHRGSGRVLAVCAAISGIYALVAGYVFPAFGGISTLSATVFFGAIFLFSLVQALRHIRHKRVHLHREWMIRTFGLAAGVATIRMFIVLLTAAGLSFEQAFGASFWLGFSVNLLVAEAWINHTRPRRTPATDR